MKKRPATTAASASAHKSSDLIRAIPPAAKSDAMSNIRSYLSGYLDGYKRGEASTHTP